MNEWSLLYYWTWVTVQWRWRLLYSVLVGLYRTWDDSFFHFSTSSDVISAFQIWKKKSTRRSFERQWTDLEQARSSCRCDKQHIIGLKLLIWLTPWIFDGRSFALRFWKTWDKVGFCFSPPLSLPSPAEQRNIERKRETQTESSSRKENINTLKKPSLFFSCNKSTDWSEEALFAYRAALYTPVLSNFIRLLGFYPLFYLYTLYCYEFDFLFRVLFNSRVNGKTTQLIVMLIVVVWLILCFVSQVLISGLFKTISSFIVRQS